MYWDWLPGIKAKYILVLLVVFMSADLALADTWNITKSTHFIVYYKNAPDRFLDELIDKAENYYDKIADNLGFRRFDFWLWDNRAKIYIYDNAKDYQVATGEPSWSSGCAYPGQKMIQSFPYAKDFFETTLPHEMGHIIFREFVGFNNPAVPVWLDEGVASYQQDLRFSAAGIIKDALENNRIIPLTKLSGISLHSTTNTATVDLFYAQAVSVVDFLINEFGQDRFVLFCQTLRDKKNLDKALIAAYSFENIEELDKAWKRYISR
jgi:hypothetical protein